MDLFESTVRTNHSPHRPGESLYDFYNRAAGDVWDRVRERLNSWVENIPVDKRGKVLNILKVSEWQQAHSLLWHLYVFDSLMAQGFDPEFEPEIVGTSGDPFTPDIKIERDGVAAIVEATVVFEEFDDERRREAQKDIEHFVNEELDNIGSDRFIGIEYLREGLIQDLRVSVVSRMVGQWMEKLEVHEAPKELDVIRGDWHIRFVDAEIGNRASGERAIALIGRGMYMGNASDDSHAIRDVIRKKTRRYERLGLPVIVAIQVERWRAEDKDIRMSLYGDFGAREAIERDGWVDRGVRGDFDGVWVTKNGPDRKWAPAIIAYSKHFEPAVAEDVHPLIWINPWANHNVGKWFAYDQMIADKDGATGVRLVPRDQGV